MKHSIRLCASVVAMAIFLGDAQSADVLSGGYSAEKIDNEQVIEAAKFAIAAQEKVLAKREGVDPPTIKLIEIVSASQQVVAGVNYRLHLRVEFNGEEKETDVVVWWQVWRSPNPYILTSWDWK